MKEFNFKQYLKNNPLLNESIGGYVDIKPLKEEGPFGMPEPDEENPWMQDVDGSEAYTVGEWKCYYDYPGILEWSYRDIPFDQLAVYATPNFDGGDSTPIQIDINGDSVENISLPKGIFTSFEEYAKALKPYLDTIEEKYANGLEELEKPDNIYADEEDEEGETSPWAGRIFDLGGAEIEQGIISLLDGGFDEQDILDWVKVVLEDQAEARAQGKKF